MLLFLTLSRVTEANELQVSGRVPAMFCHVSFSGAALERSLNCMGIGMMGCQQDTFGRRGSWGWLQVRT